MSNVRCRKRLSAIETGESQSVPRAEESSGDFHRFPPASSEPRAGMTVLNRTATAVGHAAAGTHINQGVSLVVAARPSASRSRARVCSAICRPPRRCRIGFSSGTLPLVKASTALLPRQQARVGVVPVVARSHGGENWLSNAKVSRPSYVSVWLGHGRKGGSSKAAPNHFIEGTVKGLRPSPAPHVER